MLVQKQQILFMFQNQIGCKQLADQARRMQAGDRLGLECSRGYRLALYPILFCSFLLDFSRSLIRQACPVRCILNHDTRRIRFGRSELCPGVIYDARQHRANGKGGLPSNFLWFPDEAAGKDPKVAAYIALGEKQELHTRYKCRIRKPWYAVPSVYATEIGMLKRSHDAPRLILNKVGAYTTDTAYRVRSRGISAETVVGAFVNPLTALSAELEGRTYGGGVLELVPSEIERLLIPVPADGVVDVRALDRAVRTTSMQDILSDHGAKVLAGIGLTEAKSEALTDAWSQLRNRRQRIGGTEEDEA